MLLLPFPVRALAGVSTDAVLATGSQGSALVDLGTGAVVEVPLAATHAVRVGAGAAFLDPDREEIVVARADGSARAVRLPGLSPRELALSGDGRLLGVRCQALALTMETEGDAAPLVLYDQRADPALPPPRVPFDAFVQERGAVRQAAARPLAPSRDGACVLDPVGRPLPMPPGLEPLGGEESAESGCALLRLQDARRRPRVVIVAAGRVRADLPGGVACLVPGRESVAVADGPRLFVVSREGRPLPLPSARARAVALGAPALVDVPPPAATAGASPDAVLVSFLARYPDHPEAASLWGEVGRRRRDEGRTEDAIAAFRRSLATPTDPRERDESLDFELCDLYQERGMDREALAEIDRLLARLAAVPDDPAIFEASMRKADILRARLQRPEEAIPIYRGLIASYERFFPEDRERMRRDKARLFLGESLEAVGDKREALSLYEAIVAESVTGTFAHYAGERASRLGAGSSPDRAPRAR